MNMNNPKIGQLIERYPFVLGFFEENELDIEGHEDISFEEYLGKFSERDIEDYAIVTERLMENLKIYIEQMKEFLGMEEDTAINSLTILPGHDKEENTEGFKELNINKSQIISIVGPTGSGKSRLLADIEWTAQNDTPTGRTILINGEIPDKKWRFSSNNRLVAQLSQN